MDQPDLSALKVLVVEDNPVNQMVAKRFLAKWGAQVSIAENGLEALQKLEAEPFSVVLMDIQMPVMDGLTCSKRIRAHSNEAIQRTPIIALTGDHEEATLEAVMGAGMNAHLTKPINPLKLSRALSELS
jgi:two-component system sensor histidine kinase/response regulator